MAESATYCPECDQVIPDVRCAECRQAIPRQGQAADRQTYFDVTCTDPVSGHVFPRMRIKAQSPEDAAEAYRNRMGFVRLDLKPVAVPAA